MAKSEATTNPIYDHALETAVKTGFLFDVSINHYENHTREELVEQGYSADQIECAHKVLAEFNTSVGAKLGRCPEELWSIHKCADCGATVDIRKTNSFPMYGESLCALCNNRRNSERKCFKCGNKTDDPAEDFPPVNRHYVGKDESKRDRYEYICTWCALSLGYPDFLRKRGGTDREFEDLSALVGQLRLARKDDPVGPPNERMDRPSEEVTRFNWYFESEQGLEFGKKWSDYHISYTGILYATLREPPGPDFDPFPFTGWLVKDKTDPRKLYWICRVRIRYKKSLVYLEILDGHLTKPQIEIKNIRPQTKEIEISKLWEARKLFFKIEERFGRPSSLPNDWNSFLQDYLYIWAIFDYRDGRKPRQNEIADFYHVDRTTLFRHCKNKLKKSWPEIVKEAEKIAQPMPFSDIPHRFLRFYGIQA